MPVASFAYSQMPEFLCELGVNFYNQGRYSEAMHEFKKALIIDPTYEPALRYIQMIEQMNIKDVEYIPPSYESLATSHSGSIREILDLVELQRDMIESIESVSKKTEPLSPQTLDSVLEERVLPPKVIYLDNDFSNIRQPVEIIQGNKVIIYGNNIQRFLVTEPEIIDVERVNADQIIVTGKGIGHTYLHIWDSNGRWTTEFIGGFPQPKGASYEEMLRKEEESARNFKLRYTLDWSSFESGRRLDNLNRGSYSWVHGLGFYGPTPYGDFDSSADVRSLKKNSDLSYATIGLTNGQFGQFKGFSIRLLDYMPYFSNLAFSGSTLRGGFFSSPAFNNKLSYSIFWGREGGGRYGNLSPSLTKTKHSFIDGVYVDYSPSKRQNYKVTAVHGWGRDREDYLNRYNYDLSSTWNFDKWNLNYEIANDTERFAHLLKWRFSQQKISVSAEARNVDERYNSITETGWHQGEIGGLLNLSYSPTDKLSMSSSLDVYRDRLFPSEDNNNRWNEDFSWGANYQLDDDSALNLNYDLQNQLGRLSQYRYQSSGVGYTNKIHFIKDISTYMNYYHQDNKNYSAPSSDYINDRFFAGMRFNVVGELYYYLNKEINLLQEKYYGTEAHPHALEMGLDWSKQIGATPFYGIFRFTYRDEEDTVSNLGFLSGEDYIEGYSELSFRPGDGGKELYGSCRVRNVWADKDGIEKRIEADFNAGMRYLWDTGRRWDSVGSVDGYVFKDYNSDGLRQRDEPPVEGVKVWVGKDRTETTDIFGYFKFTGVKGRKVFINLDTTTIQPGFVITVPVTQDVPVIHHGVSRVYFGIVSRSEISGIVFEDSNGNGLFDVKEKGVEGVVITLEDGKKSVTDNIGRYSFPNASAGEHIVELHLDSLPVQYLPKTSLSQKLYLFEGVTYHYDIPLDRIEG